MKTIHACRIAYVLVILGGLLAACDDDQKTIGDSVPPAPIADLVVGRPSGNSLTVAWTASGDDTTTGRATYYDLRYSKDPISEGSWSDATQYVDASAPFRSGVFQGCQVFGLESSVRYYFAIRVADEVENWSEISNIVSALTAEYSDSIPPSPIVDLTVDSTTSSSIALSWTVPGDDGMTGHATVYDARFSVAPILTEVDWSFSARLIGEPTPAQAGAKQSMIVTGLVPNRELFFAIRVGDEITNWSSLSPQALGKTQPAEIIPPATITDLRLGLVTFTSAEFRWTAPGDDSLTGQAAEYDFRYDYYPLSEESWNTCVYVLNEPRPAEPGATQSVTVSGLGGYRLHYFAIKTRDEIPNWSRLSNVVKFSTSGGTALEDTIPPAPIVDLAVIARSRTALTLRWQEPGDDNNFGNPSRHDMRYSTDSITEPSWESAQVVDYVVPTRPAGSILTMDLKDLAPGTTYFIAIKTSDDIPNWSSLSNIARGTTAP